MNDIRYQHILDSIKNSIDQAPIDLLEKIKGQNVVKMINHDEITTQQKKISLKPILSFASIAAVFLFVFFNFQQLRLADSHIYLDINPGIHMTTNRKDKVIKLEAINQDAIKIINEIEYKGKDLNMVTELILESLLNNDYINSEDEIMLLSVFNKDKEKGKKQADELNAVINEKLDNINRKPILLTQALDKSNTIEDYAKEYGISFGKMTFIRNMIILNPDLKTGDLVNLSLTELIAISQENGIDIDRILDSDDIKKPEESSGRPNAIPRDDDDDDINDDNDDDENDEDDDNHGKVNKDNHSKNNRDKHGKNNNDYDDDEDDDDDD